MSTTTSASPAADARATNAARSVWRDRGPGEGERAERGGEGGERGRPKTVRRYPGLSGIHNYTNLTYCTGAPSLYNLLCHHTLRYMQSPSREGARGPPASA